MSTALVGLATIIGTTVAVLQYADEAAASSAELSLDSPDSLVVPRCAVLGGRASGTGDKRLWLAFQTSSRLYTFTEASIRSDGRWSSSPKTISGANDHDLAVPVTLFLLPAHESQFLSGIIARANNGAGGYWLASSLPATATNATTFRVKRDSVSEDPC